MNIHSHRINKLENTRRATEEEKFNKLIFVDRSNTGQTYDLKIFGLTEFSGSKEEVDHRLKPYIEGGSSIIWDDIE